MGDHQTRTASMHELGVQRFEHGQVRKGHTFLAVEAALEVMIGGRSHSLLMQTPGAERELVTGYLFTEGLIESAADIAAIDFEDRPEVMTVDSLRARVTLPGLDPEASLPERPSISLASCGLCGKEDLEKLGRGVRRIRSKQRFSWDVLAGLLSDLKQHQPLYQQTRGVHAAAMYTSDGGFLCCFEDVGRHNAVDKVIGHALISGWSFQDKLVVLSGRSSLEMILKTARAGLPLLICFSSPTVLAVEAAKTLNLTLVGRQTGGVLAGFTHTRRLVRMQEDELTDFSFSI